MASKSASINKSVSIMIPTGKQDGSKQQEGQKVTENAVNMIEQKKNAVIAPAQRAVNVKKQIQQMPVEGYRNFETQELHLL